VRNGSARLGRAIGRRARRTTGQGDRRFSSSRSGWGLHLLSWVGSSPSFDRRWPNRIRYVGVGATFERRPVFSCRPRSLTPRAGFRLRLPSGFGTPRLGPSPLATWRSGDLLLSPSAPPMRCPGAVTPPRRPARGSVRPRPASSLRSGSCSGVRARLRCLGPKTGWQPVCRRSDGAASADHLPLLQRRGRAGTLSVERGEKMGSLGVGEGEREGRRWSSTCDGRREPAAGRPRSRLNPAARLPASPGDVRDRRSAAMRGAEGGEELDLRLARRASGVSRQPRRGRPGPHYQGWGKLLTCPSGRWARWYAG
jgi:hypothetical protein